MESKRCFFRGSRSVDLDSVSTLKLKMFNPYQDNFRCSFDSHQKKTNSMEHGTLDGHLGFSEIGGQFQKHRDIYQEPIKHSVSPGLLIPGDSHIFPLRRCEFYILFGFNRHKMCNAFSFETLEFFRAFNKNTSGHLWKSFGHKRKDQASWRHHIDVILGDVPIRVALSHGQRTTGLAIRFHCCFLYWRFMKSLFVVILPFVAVTIPGIVHFKCQPPQPKVQTCLKHHLECIGRIWNWFAFPKGNII